MNIKKQIRNLYMYEIISGLQIVDAVWVLFLLQRGFSLAQAGVAEGFFHAVSMCCEIPSGMISDTIGRRKTLILSGVFSAVSALCMILTDNFGVILLSMGLNAFGYNLVSGTREALTYDSLLQAKEEERYLKISSVQEMLYQGLLAVANLLSILTVCLGYKKAYLIAVFQGLLCALVASRLWEAEIKDKDPIDSFSLMTILRELKRHFVRSFRFLLTNRLVCIRMLISGVFCAGCYLVYMFMQEHLVEQGLLEGLIGIPLVLISLGSMAGAALGAKTERVKLSVLFLTAGIGGGIFIALSGSENLAAAVLCAGAAHCLSEAVTLRAENENQKLFPSNIRATMVSASSMVYSMWMTGLSPLAGWAAKEFSIQTAFTGLGLFTALFIGLLVLTGERRKHGEAKGISKK